MTLPPVPPRPPSRGRVRDPHADAMPEGAEADAWDDAGDGETTVIWVTPDDIKEGL